MSLNSFPLINACLNALAAVFLCAGYLMIRSGKIQAHRACMLTAFACSCVFLGCYLYYHAHAGIIYYHGTGWKRIVYFPLLISHTILAIAIVPLILRTLYLALRERFETHRRWARWTLPLWFYVSVTGVVVYKMLF